LDGFNYDDKILGMQDYSSFRNNELYELFYTMVANKKANNLEVNGKFLVF